MNLVDVKLLSITIECPECGGRINLSEEDSAICPCGAKFNRCVSQTLFYNYLPNFGMPSSIKSTIGIGCMLPKHSRGI